ncbi:chaperone protein dnaJ 49 [Artemisia annua]|uniref:Chaperone protein dnaJ 49 n=1 Tax=Artemisia annua TaxID=35608 RepID=A0A2U1QK21_ARTAN|nr:chaperone protein dnaJ 49 [Artemisia annua]
MESSNKKYVQGAQELQRIHPLLRRIAMIKMEVIGISCLAWIAFWVLIMLVYGKRDPIIHKDYSLEINDRHEIPMMNVQYGILFYVKSWNEFNQKYPLGTHSRIDIENTIISDYVHTVREYCAYELKWFIRRPDFPTPTPFCSKLQHMHKELGAYALKEI